jgi:8-oxo-dGTP diphosphatase
LTPLHTFTDDHGDWKYETVIARAAAGLTAHEVNDESHEVRWVDIEKVDELPLHPSFAKSWPELVKLLNNFIGPR